MKSPTIILLLLGLVSLPELGHGQGAKPGVRPAAKPAARPVARPAVARPAKAAPAPASRSVARTARTVAEVVVDNGPAVRYQLSFPNAMHHEARVTATFSGLPSKPVRILMARTSPGRYAQHDFAKNIYYVVATSSSNQPLPTTRADTYTWDVTPAADGVVMFSYTLYGDRTDGTYVGIDQQHAHLNMPATLCYAQGLEGRAAEVKFDMPATWKVATQMQPGGDKNTFIAPNLQHLMDSPVSLGAQQTRTWQEGEQSFEVAMLHGGTNAELDNFAKNTQKIIREERAIFGELPQFDFSRYTFIANYMLQADRDGMEHRNSCSLTSPTPLSGEGMRQNLGTVAHEFIHTWNIERLRPQDLEPFDFQQTNMSDALWFGEGFTSYLGELALRRAKVTDDEDFFNHLSHWVNARQNSPGARYASAVDMSRQAPFIDQAASIDPTNKVNTTLSYYDQGAGMALALDLQLRAQHRSSLDKFMQAMWQEFGQKQANYAPAKPYTLNDLQRVLGEVAKDTTFAGRFFRQYVYGREQPRFAENLLLAGLAVVPTRALGAALSGQVEFDEEGRCLVANNTTIGSGLYKAGIDRGDQIVVLDGKDIKSPNELDAVLRKHSPSDLVLVKIRTRGGVERNLQLVLTEDPNVQVQPVENVAKMTLSPKQKELREAWLKSGDTGTAAPALVSKAE